MNPDDWWLVTGRMPAWKHYSPESPTQKGYGYALDREDALRLAQEAASRGWKDVTIWEPPAQKAPN